MTLLCERDALSSLVWTLLDSAIRDLAFLRKTSDVSGSWTGGLGGETGLTGGRLERAGLAGGHWMSRKVRNR